MRRLGFGRFLVLILLCFLLFSDSNKVKTVVPGSVVFSFV